MASAPECAGTAEGPERPAMQARGNASTWPLTRGSHPPPRAPPRSAPRTCRGQTSRRLQGRRRGQGGCSAPRLGPGQGGSCQRLHLGSASRADVGAAATCCRDGFSHATLQLHGQQTRPPPHPPPDCSHNINTRALCHTLTVRAHLMLGWLSPQPSTRARASEDSWPLRWSAGPGPPAPG